MAVQDQVGSSGLNVDTFHHQLNTLATENQYVTFQIEEEEYGIDIMLVQEITRYNKPTRVYNSNPTIKGVINFRGKVIPIVDMRRKFNLPEQEYDPFTVVIVIERQNKTMGMIVDRVSDIMSFNAEDIQEVDREFADDIKTEHVKAMAKTGDRIVMLLAPDQIMSFDDFKQVQENVQQGKDAQQGEDTEANNFKTAPEG